MSEVHDVTDGGTRTIPSSRQHLALGNLGARRDLRYERDYVEAMWRMLQQPTRSDYAVGTGISQSVRDLVDPALTSVGRDWCDHGGVDPTSVRRTEMAELVADPGQADQELGWYPRTRSEAMSREMLGSYRRAESLDSDRCITARPMAAATNIALALSQSTGDVGDSAPRSGWTERAKMGARPNLASMSALLCGLRNGVPVLATVALGYASGRRVPNFEAGGSRVTVSGTEPSQRLSSALPIAPDPTPRNLPQRGAWAECPRCSAVPQSHRSGTPTLRATFCGCRRAIDRTHGTAPTRSCPAAARASRRPHTNDRS